MNAKMKSDLEVLSREVSDLRSQADGLMKDNKELTSQLKSMRKNISMASEFVAQAVNVSQEDLENAPELEVLAELASKDREETHTQELKTFAGVPLSMLNIVGKRVPPSDVLLARLGEALKDASVERDESMAKLGEAFDNLFAEGQAQRKAVMDEQMELNATLESTLATKQKMIKAVRHLTETKKELLSRVKALHVFGHLHLGAGTEPASKQYAKREMAASKEDEHATNEDAQAAQKSALLQVKDGQANPPKGVRS